ncbi:hypothetical protein PUV54_00050 [Hyphococcus flavus]|uniref:Uncharacterized protein n=1 Tax=Hyphococcus flavus TaxID=1866326 RepID=A0AAF0CBQ5_9PROT|nr:hypothetical protein [Hyphococcus flavus]WDI31585.1 hypothetical protein PUV54_00050 [Hyphococcus flavus]
MKTYYAVAHRRGGRLLHASLSPNLVVDEGIDDLVDKYFKGAGYSAAHYVGIMAASPTIAAGDTMASHGGWTEITDYDEASRPAYAPANAVDHQIANQTSPAQFTFNASVTVGGLFLTTNNAKGGAGGLLYSGASLAGGNLAVQSGDTLDVVAIANAGALLDNFRFLDSELFQFLDGETVEFL